MSDQLFSSSPATIKKRKYEEKSDETRNEDITEALAAMVFGCNLKFNLVDSPFFKRFVHCLNPTYKTPGADKLKNTILDRFYANLQSKLRKDTPRKGTILIDGWKNKSSNTKQVAVMIKPRNEKEIFLTSFDYSSTSENHQELLKSVEEAGKVSIECYNVVADSIVTDNAANVIKTGQQPSLINYGCIAHVGNLYFKDVRDEKIYKKVHEVMVAFRHSQLESEVNIIIFS